MGPNKFKCPVGVCKAVVNNIPIDGICVAQNVCQAVNVPGLFGGNSLIQSLGPLMQGVGLVLGLLNQGGGGGGGTGTGTATGAGTVCTTYTPVNDQSLVDTTPCTYYVPGSGTGTGTGTGTGGTGCSTLDQLLNNCDGTGTGTGTGGTSTTTPANTNPVTAALSASPTSGAAPLSVAIILSDTSPTCPHASVGLKFGDDSPVVVVFDGTTSCTRPAQRFTHVYQKTGSYKILLVTEAGIPVRSVTVTVMPEGTAGGVTTTGINSDIGATPVVQFPTQQSNTTAGPTGGVQVFGTGATFVASSQDGKTNSVTSGFYGSSGSQQGVIGNLCVSRPWATNFLSYIIPPSFFDSLCSSRGYQVGTPAPAPAVTQTTSASQQQVQLTQTKPTTQPTTQTPVVTTPSNMPTVTIWAVPASVSLGSRASIFWSVTDPANVIQSCTETSPDGSFSHNQTKTSPTQTTAEMLRNKTGGSTVPITSATTYTMSCVTFDGQHVTNFVTVNIAL